MAKGALAGPTNLSYQDLWNRAKPTLTSRANLFVFLVELRDIKRMFDLIPGKHFSLSDWRQVLRYGNNQHLNYNFGWKPFLKDVKNTFKAYANLDKRLSSFVKNADQDLQRHSRSTPVSKSYTTTWNPLYNANWQATLTVEYETVSAAGFRFRYSVPKYSEAELFWRGWADMLGLNVTPANIWAVIPWSFVADWFVNIGKGLDTFSTDWVEPELQLFDAYYSTKWKYKGTISIQYVGGG